MKIDISGPVMVIPMTADGGMQPNPSVAPLPASVLIPRQEVSPDYANSINERMCARIIELEREKANLTEAMAELTARINRPKP